MRPTIFVNTERISEPGRGPAEPTIDYVDYMIA